MSFQKFSLDVKERMAETLADAGPSISITSLTNLLSFGIGIFTPTPAIYVGKVFSLKTNWLFKPKLHYFICHSYNFQQIHLFLDLKYWFLANFIVFFPNLSIFSDVLHVFLRGCDLRLSLPDLLLLRGSRFGRQARGGQQKCLSVLCYYAKEGPKYQSNDVRRF